MQVLALFSPFSYGLTQYVVFFSFGISRGFLLLAFHELTRSLMPDWLSENFSNHRSFLTHWASCLKTPYFPGYKL